MKYLPDGPTMNGLELLNLFMTNPFPFLRDCYAKYGDMFTLELGDFGISQLGASGKWVFLCNADYLKILFKTNSAVQLAGAANRIQFMELMPSDGSVMMDGDEHLARRKVLSKLVQGEKKIRGFAEAIRDIVDAEIKSFPSEQSFQLTPSFRRISGEVMRHLTFGSVATDDTAQASHLVSQFGDPSIPPEGKKQLVNDCLNVFDNMMSACPHAAATADDNSVYSVLMNASRNDKVLDAAAVRAELLVVMLGGVDTTASTMAWIVARIMNDPVVFAKVQDELKRVFADHEPSAEDYDQLIYLDAVILETCRISPLLMNSSARLLIQPLEIDGYMIPAGTMLVSCMHIIHTREDYYPEPCSFKPERFVGINPDPYKHVYFGGGIRRCLGMAFALYEMKVVVATLLHRCRFTAVDVSVEPELQGSFFGPKGSLEVKFLDGQ